MRTARLAIRPVTEPDRSRFLDLFSDSTFMAFSRSSGPLGKNAAHLRFDRMLALTAEIPFCNRPSLRRQQASSSGTPALTISSSWESSSLSSATDSSPSPVVMDLPRRPDEPFLHWHVRRGMASYLRLSILTTTPRGMFSTSLDSNWSNIPASRGSTLSSTTSQFESATQRLKWKHPFDQHCRVETSLAVNAPIGGAEI